MRTLSVLQWNILADGLANDGFLVPLSIDIIKKHQIHQQLNITIEEYYESQLVPFKNSEGFLKKNLMDLFNATNCLFLFFKLYHKKNVKEVDLKNWMANKESTIEKPDEWNVKKIGVEFKENIHELIQNFKKTWFISIHIENIKQLIDVKKRKKKISSIVEEYKPDIMVFEEDDYLEDFNGYSNEINGKRCKISKTNSTSKQLKLLRGDENPVDDGTSVYWKKEKFDAIEDYKLIYFDETVEQRTGIILVPLKEKQTNKSILIIGTHLGSGKSENNESYRVQQIEKGFKNIKSLNYVDKFDCVILSMDGNSNPNFKTGKFEKEPNMWNTLKSIIPLKGIWENGIDTNSIWSVNKFRGAASDQYRKIGEYERDFIDYVAYSGDLVFEKMLKELNVKDEKIFFQLLPNEENPSDHTPLIVEFSMKEK